jgi:hypothetical protein
MNRWIDHGRAVLAGCAVVVAAIVALGMFAVIQRPPVLNPDGSPRSHLRNALAAAKTLYTDAETYRYATPHALTVTEPSLHFGSPQQADESTIGVTATDQTIFFVTREAHGAQRWYCLLEDDTKPPGATTYGQGPTFDSVASGRCRRPSW